MGSLENSGPLIDGATEAVKKTIKQECGLLGAMVEPMTASLISPMASSSKQSVLSSLINAIT